MIITDPEPTPSQAPLKTGDGQRLDELPPPSPGPPAYVPYQSQPGFPAQPVHVQYRQSPARRFFEAFAVAVMIYTLCAAFTSTIVWNVQRHHGRWNQIDRPNDDKMGWPAPSDGPTNRCVGGGDWLPYALSGSKYSQAAYATFDLPLSSDALYLVARGSLAYGNVKIEVSQDGGDKVIVDMVAQYHTQQALFRANVCFLQRGMGENGIGIFTPQFSEHRSREDLLQFNITVNLPVKYSHLRLNSLETDLPSFMHEVGDLAKTIKFRYISLRGSNMPIYVQSLYADHASLQTSNGPITGTFNSSTSLELHTSNAPISAHVGLMNDPSGNLTNVVMITNNSPLHASISLLSSKSKGGSFNVTTKTSNSPIIVNYDTSPVDSILYYSARTCNSPAEIELNSAYEGTFSLQTSIFSPKVDHTHAVDPSGQGRKRSMQFFRAGRSNILGEVHWGQNKPTASNVEIVTSNSPVTIKL